MRRSHVVLGALAVLVALLLTPTQAPVFFGTATSDSMAPTISPGDAYLVNGNPDPAVGDVVVFWSTERGTYVTHRIVGVREGGFVTKGDANPSTDQAGGHPPVRESAVVGEVVTVAGAPVAIPALGGLVSFVRANGVFVVGLVVAFGTLLGIRDRARGGPDRSVVRVGDVFPPVLAGLAVFGVTAVVLGANAHALTYVAVAGDTPAAHTVPLGESTTTDVTLEVSNPGINSLVVHADGVEIVEHGRAGSRLELTVRVPPPESAGAKQAMLTTVTYPPTLPSGLLDRLYDLHPMAAAAASVGVVLVPLYLLYLLGLDPERPLRAPRIEAVAGGGE